MLGVFKKSGPDSERGNTSDRTVRHSRGWGELNTFLHGKDGLRVLDFGATSPANINYLTALGHSVYMANPVSDAAGAEWRPTPNPEDGDMGQFDIERFCAACLSFSDRVFDVILLWDTANFLPAELVAPFFRRMNEVLQPGGRLLAFFHSKNTGPETIFARYQLADSEDLFVLRSGTFPVVGLYQNRQIDQFFQGFADVRFFLGKDNVREVYATR